MVGYSQCAERLPCGGRHAVQVSWQAFWCGCDDAAGKLVKFFLDSDVINFMVGAKLNQAHYDPNLPIEIEIRKYIVKKIAKILEEKFFKRVSIQYM